MTLPTIRLAGLIAPALGDRAARSRDRSGADQRDRCHRVDLDEIALAIVQKR